MVDRDTHARKAKHYFVGPRGSGKGRYQRKGYLPVALEEGLPARVPVSVSDTLNLALSDGELRRATLAVRIVSTCPEDRFSFRINGNELTPDPDLAGTFYGGMVSPGGLKLHTIYQGELPQRIGTHYWFGFNLSPGLVRTGENEVEVTLDRRFQPFKGDRIFHHVDIRLYYKERPAPIGGQM